MATTVDKYYATEEEKQPFGGGSGYQRISAKTSESEQPFLDSQTLRSPTTKYIILGYTAVVSIVVFVKCQDSSIGFENLAYLQSSERIHSHKDISRKVTVVLSVVQGLKVGAAYLLLGFSILCIAAVELVLIYLLKKDEIPREKLWFVFVVGFCIFIESVLTNVLLYH